MSEHGDEVATATIADLQKVDVDELTMARVREILTQVGLPTTGSKSRQRERLREHLQQADKDEIQEDDTSTMTLVELRQRLKQLNLKSSGNKSVLCARLEAALNRNNESVTSNKNDGEEEEESNEDSRLPNGQDTNFVNDSKKIQQVSQESPYSRPTTSHQSTLSFRDVEEALEVFSGEGNRNIRKWVRSFEETAELCQWTDMQKVIYAKRLLRGAAKLFINFECDCVKSWNDIKLALVNEFAQTLSSKDVHKNLGSVKKRNDETFQEYIYRVLDIASHAEIELEAKIEYIVDGVQDDESNKTILYGASTISELRKKFMFYEKMKKMQQKTRQAASSKSQMTRQNKHEFADRSQLRGLKHCFMCGDKTHLKNDCPNKEKGMKCFRCNEFGHRARECPTVNKTCDTLLVGSQKIFKEVTIRGKKLNALIDSGSDLHVMTWSKYLMLGSPKMRLENIPFKGVGSHQLYTIGSFETVAIMDDIEIDLKVHVVPDRIMSYDIILGNELTNSVEIHLKQGHARCVRTKETKDGLFYTFEELKQILSTYIQTELDTVDKDSVETALKSTREKIAKIDILERNLKQMSSEINRLVTEKSKVEHESSTLQADVLNYEIECVETIHENNEETILILEKQLQDSDRLNRSLEDEYNEMHLHLASLEQDKTELLAKIENSQDSKDNLNTRIRDLQLQIEVLETEKCNLVFELNEMKTDDKKSAMGSEMQERLELRANATRQIKKIQEENAKGYNRKRKKAYKYKVGDIVAIKRTQLGSGRKLYGKFLGPYKVKSVLRNDRYLVEKLGEHEGPNNTSSAADHMKLFPGRQDEMMEWESSQEEDDKTDTEDDVKNRMAEL